MLFTIFLLFVSAKLEDIFLALVPFLIKSILEIIKVTLVELDLTIKKMARLMTGSFNLRGGRKNVLLL